MEPAINSALATVSPIVSPPATMSSSASASLISKRCLDVALASLACLILSPLLVLVAGVLLVLQGRPLLIAHRRVGRDGKRFSCLKFRTMVIDADAVLARHLETCAEARDEWAQTRKLRKDPRVTTFGAALRASSVDELPQFINVLFGDMSLVGPRPVVDDELALYGAHVQKYLEVRPGLTGAWQVSGRSNTSFADRVKLDVEYVDSWGLLSDLGILLRTVPAVLMSKGAV